MSTVGKGDYTNQETITYCDSIDVWLMPSECLFAHSFSNIPQLKWRESQVELLTDLPVQ